MRVLLNFRSGFAGLKEGFEALGHEVIENHWQGTQGAALCIADFVDCVRQLGRTRAHARMLRAERVPFIALARDAPWHRGVHRLRLAAAGLLQPFDGYATHSMQQAGRFAAKVIYCPNAARERVYQASPAEIEAMRDAAWYRWDVSFIGNLDATRYPEHRARLAFFSALEARLVPLGLRVRFADAARISIDEQLDTIRRSRVNVSAIAACDAGAAPSWGLPERCYGVPACGGLLLSDRRRHAADDFAADERAEFDGLEDCVRQLRSLLDRPAHARGIAERAHARVMREHRYRDRAARLIDFARLR